MAESAPEEITLATLQELITNTAEIRDEIRDENILRNEENKKRDRRIRLSRILIAIVFVFSVGATYVGFSGRRDAHDAKVALAAYKADTQRVRINACNQSVTEKRDLASLEKDLERARRTQTPEAKALTKQLLAQLHITPEQLNRLTAEQLLSFDAKVNEKIRIRDCSVKGLADYLNGHGGYLPTSTTTAP